MSGSDFARTSLLIPCYRELASLLSRINSLFCLPGNLFVSNWIPSVFETDLRKKRSNWSNFPVFFPVSREFRFSRSPEVAHGKPPRSRLWERGILENRASCSRLHALPRLDPGTGMTGGGSDLLFLGVVLVANPSRRP